MHREFALSGLQPVKIGSALDLANAYFQVSLHPQVWKTMGVTVGGRFFEYMQLPFGYNNSLHEFLQALWPTIQRVKRRVRSQVYFYMDDILLLSTNEE